MSKACTGSPRARAASSVAAEVATHLMPVNPRAASAGRKWATVVPVPSPMAMPSSTSSAAAWAAARFSSSPTSMLAGLYRQGVRGTNGIGENLRRSRPVLLRKWADCAGLGLRRTGAGGSVREPEPETIHRARAGDLRAFESLVREYQADVWRFAYHLTRNRAMAEDVTQEAFLKAFRSLRSFRGEAKFSSWLLRITRNCAVDA